VAEHTARPIRSAEILEENLKKIGGLENQENDGNQQKLRKLMKK